METARAFGCNRCRLGCDFAILRAICGKVLTDLQIAALIRDGHTRLIKGLRDDQGQQFEARLELDSAFKVRPRPCNDRVAAVAESLEQVRTTR